MRKLRIQAMVKPEVEQELKKQAKASGISVSSMAGWIIEMALMNTSGKRK